MSSTIDLSYRPESYWPKELDQEQLLSKIQGQERRKIARKLLAEGRVEEEEVSEFLFQDVLSDSDKQQWGLFHPTCMGGEYLPAPGPNEVEIARVSLKSTTADQISIRAQRKGSQISYSVVDEYGTVFELQRERSKAPLTLQQLIQFVDGSGDPENPVTGLLLSHWEFATESSGVREAVAFAQIESAFYQQLADHYSEVAREWCLEKLRKERDELREERRQRKALSTSSASPANHQDTRVQ